jgi:hypothetical protein
MKPLSESQDIRVPIDRLFLHLASRWETGSGLHAGGVEQPPACVDRMGDGFTARCPATLWALPVDAELVVSGFTPLEGWRAVSTDPPVVWETRLTPTCPATTRLTCTIHYRPTGAGQRLRERVVARRRRSRMLRRLLESWRDGAERQEALRRLRSVRDHEGPGPAPAPNGRD